MCHVDLKCTVPAGQNSLYDLYFYGELFKTGLTWNEATEEIRKKELEERNEE